MTNRLCCVVAWLCLGGIYWNAPIAAEPPKKDAKADPMLVKLDRFSSMPPREWQAEKPKNRLRSHQFRLPKVSGDKYDAEIAILPDVRGTPEQNFARIRGMFVPEEGRDPNQMGKVEKFKVATADVTMLDITGTCLYKEQPFNPKEQAELRPNFRIVSVIFETPDGSYHIRFAGPANTVAKYKKGFDDWLKAFKKDG